MNKETQLFCKVCNKRFLVGEIKIGYFWVLDGDCYCKICHRKIVDKNWEDFITFENKKDEIRNQLSKELESKGLKWTDGKFYTEFERRLQPLFAKEREKIKDHE